MRIGRRQGMGNLTKAAIVALVLGALFEGRVPHRAEPTVDDERERIAPLLGVQPSQIKGNGHRPPGGWPGDRTWDLAASVPGKHSTTVTTRHGRIAFYDTFEADGHYLRLPGWPAADGMHLTAEEAEIEARQLAMRLWMQDAPSDAKLSVSQAELDPHYPGNYAVGLAFTNGGRYVPPRATIGIDVRGRGCQFVTTKGW